LEFAVSTLLLIVVGLTIVLGLAGYLFLMIFFPEWVGITGKVARENMKSHEGDDSTLEE
jgi:hypothetical protein